MAVYSSKMVIFHSYVSLPEGKPWFIFWGHSLWWQLEAFHSDIHGPRIRAAIAQARPCTLGMRHGPWIQISHPWAPWASVRFAACKPWTFYSFFSFGCSFISNLQVVPSCFWSVVLWQSKLCGWNMNIWNLSSQLTWTTDEFIQISP